jgi:hypothetical protein
MTVIKYDEGEIVSHIDDLGALRARIRRGDDVVGRCTRGEAAGQLVTITPLPLVSTPAEIWIEFHPGFWSTTPGDHEGQLIDEWVTALNGDVIQMLRQYGFELLEGEKAETARGALTVSPGSASEPSVAVSSDGPLRGTCFLFTPSSSKSSTTSRFLGMAVEMEPPAPGTNFDAETHFWGDPEEWEQRTAAWHLDVAPEGLAATTAEFVFGYPSNRAVPLDWTQRRASEAGPDWRMIEALREELTPAFVLRSGGAAASLVREAQTLTASQTGARLHRATRPATVLGLVESLRALGCGLFLVPARPAVAATPYQPISARTIADATERLAQLTDVSSMSLRIRDGLSTDFLRRLRKRGDVPFSELVARLFMTEHRLAVARADPLTPSTLDSARIWDQVEALLRLQRT